MEFGEKLQQLRKEKGLTQEDLAEALFVSRTAVSKWESGRGYPSIDSLKELSRFFSVTIDDLLSGEKLLSIAETEKKDALQTLYISLLRITDLFSVLLILLPLYPQNVNGFVYSVNLLAYTQTTARNRTVYWILYLFLFSLGLFSVAPFKMQSESHDKTLMRLSLMLGAAAVLILALAGESYATAAAFLLLLIKCIFLYKSISADP